MSIPTQSSSLPIPHSPWEDSEEVSLLLEETLHSLRSLHDMLHVPELHRQLSLEAATATVLQAPLPRVLSTEMVSIHSSHQSSTTTTPRTPGTRKEGGFLPSTPPFGSGRSTPTVPPLPHRTLRYQSLRTTRHAAQVTGWLLQPRRVTHGHLGRGGAAVLGALTAVHSSVLSHNNGEASSSPQVGNQF